MPFRGFHLSVPPEYTRGPGSSSRLVAQRGFVDGPGLVRMRAEPSAPVAAPGSGAPLAPADLEQVFARDREVFGADRSAVVRWALASAPDVARVEPRS